MEVLDKSSGKKEEEQVDKEIKWTVVLSLDHIRSRKYYIKLLERWTHQLQLFGMLLLGRSILVLLHGDKPKIKVKATQSVLYNMSAHFVLYSLYWNVIWSGFSLIYCLLSV